MCWLRCIIHNISDAEATNLSKSSLLKMDDKEITIKIGSTTTLTI